MNPGSGNVEPQAVPGKPFHMSRGRWGEMGACDRYVPVEILCQQTLSGGLRLFPVIIRGAAPIRARHLYRVVNSVSGDKRFITTGTDMHDYVARRMVGGGFKPDLFKDIVSLWYWVDESASTGP
jgi:hypothetical protein